jgi:hypothetical protein
MKTTLINKVLPLVVVAFIGLFFAISCEKEKNAPEPIIIDYFNNSDSLLYKDVVPLFARACRTDTNVIWRPWTWTADSLYVINTMSDFNNLLPSFSLPDFDVSKNTLFALYGTEPTLVDSMAMRIIDSNMTYKFIFDIVSSWCTEPDTWLFLFYTNRKIYPNQVDTIIINGHYQWQ